MLKILFALTIISYLLAIRGYLSMDELLTVAFIMLGIIAIWKS